MKKVFALMLVVIALASCLQEEEMQDVELQEACGVTSSGLFIKRVTETRLRGISQSSKIFLLLNSIDVRDGLIELSINKEEAMSMGIPEEDYDNALIVISKANER